MTEQLVTAENFQVFVEAYEACKEETFEFQGQTVLRAYAKYVIEYMLSSLAAGRADV